MNHNERCAMNLVDYPSLKAIIGQRKVCVWGAFSNGSIARKILEDHGIVVDAYLDGHKEGKEYDQLPLLRPSSTQDLSQYFIIIAVSGFRSEISNIIAKQNLAEWKDYIWPCKTQPSISITRLSFNYKDEFGNEVIVSEDGFAGNIILEGYNNKITVGRGLVCKGQSAIKCHGASVVSIGDYVSFCDNTEIICEDGEISIGNNTNIDSDSNVHSRNGGKIFIGKYVSIGKRFFCGSVNRTELSIGNDCMISHDVSVMSSSGHSIMDLELKKNISLEKEMHCFIGNHVWVGKGAIILCNSHISDGCIVGANSLVKLSSGQNAVIAGNPARIVSTNRTWDRRDGVEFDEC